MYEKEPIQNTPKAHEKRIHWMNAKLVMFLLIQKAATEDAHQTKVCTFLGTELLLHLVLGAKVRDKRHHCPYPAKENLALRRMPGVKTLARSSASANQKHFDQLVCYKIKADSWAQQAGKTQTCPTCTMFPTGNKQQFILPIKFSWSGQLPAEPGIC